MKMGKSEGIIRKISELRNQSFEGWSDDSRNGYLTALKTIEWLVNPDSQSPTEPEFDTLQEGDWFTGTEEQYYLVLKMFAPNEMVNNHNAKKALCIGFICSKQSRYTNRIILSFDEYCKKTQLTPEEFLRRAENTFNKK